MESKEKQGAAREDHTSIECRGYRTMFRTRDLGIAIDDRFNPSLEHPRPLRRQQEIQLRLAVSVGRRSPLSRRWFWRFDWGLWFWRFDWGLWMGCGNCACRKKWSQFRRLGSRESRCCAMPSDRFKRDDLGRRGKFETQFLRNGIQEVE